MGGPHLERALPWWEVPMVSLHNSCACMTALCSEIENSLRQARLNLILRALPHDRDQASTPVWVSRQSLTTERTLQMPTMQKAEREPYTECPRTAQSTPAQPYTECVTWILTIRANMVISKMAGLEKQLQTAPNPALG